MKKLLLTFCFVFLAIPAHASDKQADEVFDRVMKTHILRCAYIIYPTFVEKDPNTGKMSGLFYDLTEEMGRELGLKVEWTDEVGTDTLFESFKSGKADANCAGFWATPARTQGGDFTKPLAYMPYNLYVRAKETRFKTFEDFNRTGVAVSTMDGEFSQTVVAERFPKATAKSLPGLTPATDRLENVATGKADATPMEAAIGSDYMAKNPGRIQQFGSTPLQVSGSVIVIPHKEEALKAMLNTAIDAMRDTGTLDRIINAHEKYPGSILKPAKSYQPE